MGVEEKKNDKFLKRFRVCNKKIEPNKDKIKTEAPFVWFKQKMKSNISASSVYLYFHWSHTSELMFCHF